MLCFWSKRYTFVRSQESLRANQLMLRSCFSSSCLIRIPTDSIHTTFRLIVSPDSAIHNKKRHGSLYLCLSRISGLRIAYSVRIDNAASPRREEYTEHLPKANVWINTSDGRSRCRVFLLSQSCEV